MSDPTMDDVARIAAGLSRVQMCWVALPGYEGLYSISNYGDIISHPRTVEVRKDKARPYRIKVQGRVMAKTYSRKGYPQVGLSKNGQFKTKEVHRLVCRAFHGPAPEGHEAAHLNGNKCDLRASNLIWATRKENAAHKRLHGTLLAGERGTRAKLTSGQACEIVLRVDAGETRRALAREYSVSEKAIRKIVNGESWAEETSAVRDHLKEQEQ